MTRGKYAKGLIPSPPEKVGLGHPEHLLRAPLLPAAAEVLLGPVVDQGQVGSCTGNASAVAIQEAMTKTAGLNPGQWVGLPSRLWLYYCARALEGTTDQDAGAMISDVFEGAATLGVPPETAWTYTDDLAKVCAQPDWNTFRLAADQRLIKGAWRIQSTGAQRVTDVKAAIAAGNPVVWGTELDQAFEDLDTNPTGVWPGVTGPVLGGHAMILWRYQGDVFWTRSSWGEAFADGGSARISSAAVASSRASDFWIVQTATPFPGGQS